MSQIFTLILKIRVGWALDGRWIPVGWSHFHPPKRFIYLSRKNRPFYLLFQKTFSLFIAAHLLNKEKRPLWLCVSQDGRDCLSFYSVHCNHLWFFERLNTITSVSAILRKNLMGDVNMQHENEFVSFLLSEKTIKSEKAVQSRISVLKDAKILLRRIWLYHLRY